MENFYLVCPHCKAKLTVVTEEEIKYIRNYVREFGDKPPLGSLIKKMAIFKCRYCGSEVNIMSNVLRRKQ